MRNTTTAKDYTEERSAIARGFKSLADFPFLVAVKLGKKVITLTQGYPYGTPAGSWADQLYRASASVAANISEGVGRVTRGQQVQFLRTSRGSAYEVVAHLHLCPVPDLDLGSLIQDYHRLIEALDVSLGKLIDTDPAELA
jgi:four helix bundle protein